MRRRALLGAAAGGVIVYGLWKWTLASLFEPIVDRTAPSSTEGRTVFAEACTRCHGPEGEGKGGAPRLRGRGLPPGTVRSMVMGGRLAMPKFPNIRSEALANLARCVSRLKWERGGA